MHDTHETRVAIIRSNGLTRHLKHPIRVRAGAVR